MTKRDVNLKRRPCLQVRILPSRWRLNRSTYLPSLVTSAVMSFDDAFNALDRRLSEKAMYRKTNPQSSSTPRDSESRSHPGLSLRELITCEPFSRSFLPSMLTTQTALEDTLTSLESELNCPVYVASSEASITTDAHAPVVATGFCAFSANSGRPHCHLLYRAAAHVANPCGHTFCGACGQKWVTHKVSAVSFLAPI
jgi:hypothetical protein